MDPQIDSYIILDMESFIYRDREAVSFIVKELGFITYDLTLSGSMIFRPPVDYSDLSSRDQRSVNYTVSHRHGLRWTEGRISFEHLPSILHMLTENVGTIYVNGYEKAKFFAKPCQRPVWEFYIPGKAEWRYKTKCDRHQYFRCNLKHGNYILRKLHDPQDDSCESSPDPTKEKGTSEEEEELSMKCLSEVVLETKEYWSQSQTHLDLEKKSSLEYSPWFFNNIWTWRNPIDTK